MSEHIGYRFGRDELAALKLLLELPALPGLNLPTLSETDYHTAIQSLTEAGAVLPAGDQMCVDRLSALLVTAATKSPRSLRLSSGVRDTLLYRTRVLCLLADCPRSGMLTLTPVQTLAEAKAALAEELPRHGEGATLELLDAEGEPLESRDADSRDALLYALDELARKLEASDPLQTER